MDKTLWEWKNLDIKNENLKTVLGLIQVNNWKPIPFESITDNQEDLAVNLFKEISSNVTLKILTKQ